MSDDPVLPDWLPDAHFGTVGAEPSGLPYCESAVGFGADQRDKMLKSPVTHGSRACADSQVVGRPSVEAELKAVAEAAGRRLGEDGLRALVRSARGAQAVQDGPMQRQGLTAIGRTVADAGEGQRAHAAQQQQLLREKQRLKGVQREGARGVPREQLGQRQGSRMGM